MDRNTKKIDINIDNFNQEAIGKLKVLVDRSYASIRSDESLKFKVNYTTDDDKIESKATDFEVFRTATSDKKIYKVSVKLWNRNCTIKIKKNYILIESNDCDICEVMTEKINWIKNNLDILLQSQGTHSSAPVDSPSANIASPQIINNFYGNVNGSVIGTNFKVGNNCNIKGSSKKNSSNPDEPSIISRILDNISTEMLSTIALRILQSIASAFGFVWLYELLSVCI